MINYIIILAGCIVSCFFFRKFFFLEESQMDSDMLVSVIIPVRNEAHNIGNLLSDLEEQDYLNLEIICIDDASTDNTADIIRKFKVNYFLNNSLPSGWKGKPWACHSGASKASGEVFIFIDADVRLSQKAISSLVAEHQRKRSPVSVQPYHRVSKIYEYLSMFFNIIQTGATGVCAGDKFKASGMFGPVFLVSKKTYNELNGFENVKDETVEDFTLGKIYEENGEKIELFLGGKLISFRMYPNGLKSLIEGWTKNFSKGAASINPFTLLAFIVWVAYLTVLPIVITASIINQKTVILIILCIIYLLTVLSLVRISKAIGSYPLACHVFYPVLIVLFHLLFIYSVLSIYILKSTRWKGRKL